MKAASLLRPRRGGEPHSTWRQGNSRAPGHTGEGSGGGCFESEVCREFVILCVCICFCQCSLGNFFPVTFSLSLTRYCISFITAKFCPQRRYEASISDQVSLVYHHSNIAQESSLPNMQSQDTVGAFSISIVRGSSYPKKYTRRIRALDHPIHFPFFLFPAFFE